VSAEQRSTAGYFEREVPVPVPAAGQVLVKVHAAGMNPDAQNRDDGSWAGLTLPAVLGSDAAGTIEALGPGVTGLRVGEPVFYFSDFLGSDGGSYAEYQAVDTGIIAPRPTSLSHAEAAAVPLAAGTAYDFDAAIDKNLTLHGVLVRPDAARLRTLAALIDAGNLRPVITREYPLEQVAAAHRELERRHAGGKLVLTIR
jgi:NADPH:quinone reductase-like Zn-dependent oxidoreductase